MITPPFYFAWGCFSKKTCRPRARPTDHRSAGALGLNRRRFGGLDMIAWRERAHRLRADVVAVALAIRDPRVPWHARALGALIVAYALSPIDLIPDFVPVTGYLDDLVLVPLGLILMLRFSKYRGGSGWRRHEISRWNAPMSTNAAGSPITLLFPDFRSVPRLNVSFSFRSEERRVGKECR